MIMKKNNRKFKPRTIYTRNFAKYNEANYKENLRNLDWENVTQEPDINNAWDTFKSLLKSVIDKHAPLTKKRVRGRDSPWFTNEIKTKTYERDYYLRKARKSGKEIDWSTYRRLRNDVTRSIRQSKADYTRQIFRENINTPRKFWNQIKKCFPTKESRDAGSKVFNVDGKPTSNVNEVANGFCKFFTSIGKRLQDVLPKLTDIAWIFYKRWRYILAEPLTTLINRCLKIPSFHQQKNARKLHQYTRKYMHAETLALLTKPLYFPNMKYLK
jgi:hypothetical protein